MASSKKTGTAKETPVIYLSDKAKRTKPGKTDTAPGVISAILIPALSLIRAPLLIGSTSGSSSMGMGFYWLLYIVPIMIVLTIILVIVDAVVAHRLSAAHRGKTPYWTTSGLISLVLLNIIMLIFPATMLLDCMHIMHIDKRVTALLVAAINLANIIASVWGLARIGRGEYISVSKRTSFWLALVIAVLAIAVIAVLVACGMVMLGW